MKRLKLFENFKPSSFEDIEHALMNLKDKGLLKIKNKPFFIIEESETGDDEYGLSKANIVARYYITQNLGKIDTIEKLDTLESLLRDFRQVMVRLGVVIDLGRKELEVKLPVPENIEQLTNHLGYPDDLDLAGVYFPYDNDIDGYPFDVKLKFTVDEDLNVMVETKINNTLALATDESTESALKKHFLDNYGLEFIGDEVRGKLKFYKFINK
jgi:hypothetical protein